MVQLCKYASAAARARKSGSTHDVEAFPRWRRAGEVERHGQAASSGSKTKAPGSAGGYLLVRSWYGDDRFSRATQKPAVASKERRTGKPSKSGLRKSKHARFRVIWSPWSICWR